MTRLSSFFRFALGIFCAAGLAVLLVPSPLSAQRGPSMGHAGGGPHFAPPMRMAGAPAPRRSPHLTYLPPFRGARPANRSSSQVFFGTNRFGTNRHIVRDRFHFHRAFGFPFDNFFPFAYGYWPWWAWDSDNWNDCRRYSGGYEACDTAPAGEGPEASSIDSVEDTQRPTIVVYLRDGSGYSAMDYWVGNGELHIITTYGAQKTFPMDDVDLERTGKQNAQHGVNFVFHTAPMVSDPGPSLAPDSYAPPCPASSSGSQSTKSAAPAPTADSQQAFGAIGNQSEKGFTITAVRAGSSAAEAGLQAGDVIVRVDCQPIRNSQELQSALAGSSGTVWVSYLIQGSWLTDKRIVR